MYTSLREGLKSKPNLIPYNSEPQLTKEKDYYTSLFQYNETHKRILEEKGTLAGITDTTTDRLYFDFDDKNNVENALRDSIEVAKRLIDLGVDQDNIDVYFSGNKGIALEIKLKERITPEQFKSAVVKLAGDLKTFDKTVNDPNRIVRIPNTIHQESKLYKIPLELYELEELTVPQIKHLAKSKRVLKRKTSPVSIPKQYFEVPKKEKPKTQTSKLDFTSKPKGWSDYAYSISLGFFESGERHNALMVLAAKCRALGYTKEQTYYLCKNALKQQAERTGQSEFNKEELWTNIIEESVYSDHWKGGSYSPQNNEWLKSYCEKQGIKVQKEEGNLTTIDKAFDSFKNYAVNIDDLTIQTGIPLLDENLRLTVGMSVGLVASPGVGKTSTALQILNNMSKNGHRCIFFSYDMYSSLVYQKLVQKHFQLSSDEIFRRFKEDPTFQNQVKEKINKEYEKVDFCFKTGQTVEDIIQTIKEAEERSGEKIKFIVMDYNELVITDYSEPTIASAFVAQKMRELANTLDICVLSLFQPAKHSGDPSDEIKSYRAAKGSGAISQSVSVMLGVSRPGFDPRRPEDDRFMTIGCLKNRMGPLFALDFRWDGLTGTIRELSEEEENDLNEIRERKKNEKDSTGGGWE